MNLSAESWVALAGVGSGTIVGVASLVLSYLSNKRTLEQSEKNLQTQLFHEDRKRALVKLSALLDEEILDAPEGSFLGLKTTLWNFLRSLDGQFLPDDTRKMIINEIKKLNKSAEGSYEQIEPSDEEIERFERERYNNLDEFERFDQDFSEQIRQAKEAIRNKIREDIKPPKS